MKYDMKYLYEGHISNLYIVNHEKLITIVMSVIKIMPSDKNKNQLEKSLRSSL